MRRLILFILDRIFYEELSDAYCRGYAKGYMAGLKDTESQEYLTAEQLREYLEISPGGTD